MIKKISIILLFCMLMFVGCSKQSTGIDNTKNQEVTPNLSSFQTTSLNGDEVTNEIFEDYDITMVNIWATWCGPCVGEIPELQNVYENLPENANLVTICTDLKTSNKAAKEIMEASEAGFMVLEPTEEMNESLLKMVTGIPTTVFVDKEGNMVGKALVGVPSKEPAQVYLAKIEELLANK